MLRWVHINECGFVLCCFFAAGAEFWEARPGSFLFFSSALIQKIMSENLDGTFDSRLSVNTARISLCFTTSHAIDPSHNSTLETGFVARSCAYSSGGSYPEGRAKGNLGGACCMIGLSVEVEDLLARCLRVELLFLLG